ncbi:V-type proton ATPase subunit a1-like isoform X1 [Camellia sinensis]|uniref:V-type proton ATPase subunit a1-like isoform X1 n=2 Tax=Camellia sinensis TaxID=4442 RepID=UPI0010367B16|nr:V-type proton ATPase subunit a1-like isoform X1 [Camellia sinensis]
MLIKTLSSEHLLIRYNLLHEHELIEMNHNIEKLRQTYNELLEFKMVLQKASGFLVSSKSHAVAEERELDDHVYSNDDYADTASLLEQEMRHEPSNQSGLRFISGIISKSKLLRFERMLFRATRGNMLFNQAPADEPILDPVTTEMVIFFLISIITFWEKSYLNLFFIRTYNMKI